MENISVFVVDYLNSVSPFYQTLWISLFAFLEGVPVVGSIVPGGTIALLAGSLSAKGNLTPFITFLFIGFFNFVGDISGFLLSKKFKHKKFIKKIVEKEEHQKNWDLFDKNIAFIAIFAKLIPVIRSTPSMFAGFRGIKTSKYLFYSFTGSFLWAFSGVYLGNFLAKVFGDNAILIIFGILLVSIFLVIFNHLKKNKNTRILY